MIALDSLILLIKFYVDTFRIYKDIRQKDFNPLWVMTSLPREDHATAIKVFWIVTSRAAMGIN